MWGYVYEAVGELGKADQLALFKAMKQDLYPKEENKMEELLPKIKESRFSSGLGCLHCGSTAVLLCTDTATNYKKFAAAKNLKHEIVTFTGIVGLSYIKTWHLKIG